MERADTVVYRVPILTEGGQEAYRLIARDQLFAELLPVDRLFFTAFAETDGIASDLRTLPQTVCGVAYDLFHPNSVGIHDNDAMYCFAWLDEYIENGTYHPACADGSLAPVRPAPQRGLEKIRGLTPEELDASLRRTYPPRVLDAARWRWLGDMEALRQKLRRAFAAAPLPEEQPQRTRRPNLLERRGLLATPPDFRDIFGLEPS